MATAPVVDAALTPDDAVDILEEILPAQNRSFELGLRLRLPHHEVEGIHLTHSDPRSRLLHVIIEFLNQAKPRPTWRVIVDALRSPAVNLPRLADKVEATHFPDPTSTRGVVTETTSTASVQAASPSQRPVVVDLPETEEASTSTSVPGPPHTTESSAATTTSDIAEDEVKSKPTIPSSDVDSSVETLKGEIKGLHRLFNRVKESTIKCLEKCQIAVMTVVYLLTSILSVDEHKKFLKEEHKVLRRCEDHLELFGELNLHWNYLSYDLLDQLIEELTLKDKAFESVVEEMAEYKREIHEFRKRTTLKLFCLVDPYTEENPPPGYRKMVTKHQWPDTTTLEEVEQFRKQFFRTFNLHSACAMIVNNVRTESFSITWFVLLPDTVITTLKKCTGTNMAVFLNYCVSVVVIDGVCVYKTPVQHEIQSLPSASVKDISSFEATSAVQKRITPSTSVSMTTKGLSMGSTLKGQLTVQCYPKKRAPFGIIVRGSATTDHQFAYFTPSYSTSVYCYEWNTEQWKELPSCPYRDSVLVIIDGALTAVGGKFEYTNKLFTLRQGQWVEEYPSMKTARYCPATVSTSDGEYIIAIGGRVHGGWTTTVELFQVKTRQWYELKNLPHRHLSHPSATICGNRIHVIGGGRHGYSCSLQALPSSDKPITPQSLPDLISWTPLPPLPVTRSTAATLSGQLVIIGGERDWSPVNSIHQLVEGQWVEVGSMTSRRAWCLSVSPSPDRVMIVGGYEAMGAQDSVEECVVVQW